MSCDCVGDVGDGYGQAYLMERCPLRGGYASTRLIPSLIMVVVILVDICVILGRIFVSGKNS